MTSPTLLSVVSQWPVASNIAENLPVGSLINLARCSSSLRAVLHGFDVPNDRDSSAGNTLPTSDRGSDVWQARRDLYVGEHRTLYWEGLKRNGRLECSSKTHTKGNKTQSCLYCSLPVCDGCIVKHSFGKTENTFKNRCRFLCQQCWDTGNPQKKRRFSGNLGGQEKVSHKSAALAERYCMCTSKDGWVCNECKEQQNQAARERESTTCFGKNCAVKLGDDKDRRKICLWCDRPVPRGRASMESRKAYDQKLMDVRERHISLQIADFEEYEGARRRQMLISRRELRGNYKVRDDPEADVEQFLTNLDFFNYRSLCGETPTGDQIWGSKHGIWKYDIRFLTCFGRISIPHVDAHLLKAMTSYETPDHSQLKTNRDILIMKLRRKMDERPEDDPLAEFYYTSDSSASPDATGEESEDSEAVGMSIKAANFHHTQATKTAKNGRNVDEDLSMQEDENSHNMKKGRDRGDSTEELGTEEVPARSRPIEPRPDELPPEYGSDTLVLETGDVVQPD